MSKPNSIVDKISSISLHKEISSELTAGSALQVKKVEFQGGKSALLDTNVPLSKIWAEIIESHHERNMPVYVEINPDTNLVTELLLPKEIEVSSLKQTSTGDYEVMFRNTAAIHYLKKENPDFSIMLDTLKNAQEKKIRLLVTDTDIDHEIIDIKAVKNSSRSAILESPLPLMRLTPTIVSEQRAKELFNLVSSRNCNPATASSPCIPFLYPDDGCWIRAELMCDLMIKESVTTGSAVKVEPEKIWIDGQLYGVKTVNHPNCAISWGWHVAPTLLVSTPKGSQRMVLDPSLFPSGPVTPENWKKVQSDPNATLTYTPRTKYNHWDNTVATEAIANSDMDYYRNQLKNRTAKYGPPPYKCPFADIGITAIARMPEHLDIFWVGKDGAIWSNWWDIKTGWSKPFTIASSNSAASNAGITAVARMPEHLDIFWTGKDGAIWTNWWDKDTGWSKPFTIASSNNATSNAGITAVARMPEHLDIFWVGKDGAIWSNWWDINTGWSKPFTIASSNIATSDAGITAVARMPEHLDIFWVGKDGAIWTNWWDISTGWSKPFTIASSNNATSNAGITAVARMPEHLDIFWTGKDGAIWSNWWDIDTGWSKPFTIANSNSATPDAGITAVARMPEHLDIFWVGKDGAIWSNWWDIDTGWSKPFTIASTNSAVPYVGISAVARMPEHLDIFWTGKDGAVWTNWWDIDTGWSKPFTIA